MSTLSNAITELEARRSNLEMELEKIMQRLRAVKTALAASDEGASAAAPMGAVKVAKAKKGRRGRKPKSATAAPAAKTAAKSAAKSTGKGGTRRWFEPGEVNELMRKLITKPTRQTDVIKQLATAKGYAGKLSKKEKMRFNWAVLSALKAAVKTKRLVKHADGKVVVR
jgi:hypothetical protein